jgi:pimeloyl-ACP methyl ester carboxylesterase
MARTEAVVAQFLATGQRGRELIAYFGEAEYHSLSALAHAAASSTQDPDRVVYIIPGIMGSQLCLPRDRPEPDNLLWLDPLDIYHGRMSLLTLTRSPIRACGPMLYGYLPLKFALETAGFTVRCFDYDWRRDIADSGAALALRLAAETARDISLVAHSMGGLVARAALRAAAGMKVQRVITLGTPHGGSFTPVQAVRGVYPLIRRLAQLDATHSAEELARDVFASFYSLYQLLPLRHALDLIDARTWPSTGPQPNATLLGRVPMLDLGGADPRIAAIAGSGFETAVNVANIDDEFLYRMDYSGDGTVPTARATIAGCEAWYCDVSHNELMRDANVHAAVVQLLNDSTPKLPGAPPQRIDAPRSVSDTQLRQQFTEKIDWLALNPAARRQYLDSLNAMPRSYFA